MNRLHLLGREHRKRYRQLLSITTKFGLDEIIGTSKFQKIPLFNKIRVVNKPITQLTTAQRVRLALEEMGGAFVKIGQLLSNRPDILPTDVIFELEKLQDTIPPFSSDEAVEIIEQELGCKLKDVFLMFDSTPLASGSIAQVHRAVLLDLTPVVVKVRRPDIESQIKIDFDLIVYASNHIAKFTQYKKQFKDKNPLNELREELEKEIDFKNEEANILHFIKNFKGDKKVFIPKVYPDYTSQKVLVMDYVKGIKITDKEKIISSGFNPNKVADDLLDVGLKQIFEHFYFHGDPHPGNIFLLENGQISFIDFGLMGSLSSKQQKTFTELVIAFAQQDIQKLTRLVYRSASKESNVNIDQVEYEITKLMDTYYDKTLKDINVGELLVSIMKFLNKYDLRLPTNVYILIKSVASYEGIGRTLSPNFEIAPQAQKYAKKLLRKNLLPTNILKELYSSSSETINLIKEFPGEARNLLQLLQQGKLTVNANIVDLRSHIDYIFKKVEKAINRVVYGIVLSSALIGTSLLLRNHEGGLYYGVPLFAALGFVVSFVLGVMLIISILRSKTL